jgi:hypothetical protein
MICRVAPSWEVSMRWCKTDKLGLSAGYQTRHNE